MSHSHRNHGNAVVGRITLGVACLLIIGANGLIYWKVAAPPPQIPVLKILTIITIPWMVAGAWFTNDRATWGRGMMLTILYAGSLGLFMTGIITVTMEDSPLRDRLGPIFIATGVYVVVTLVVTYSKHVRRLTNRTWD